MIYSYILDIKNLNLFEKHIKILEPIQCIYSPQTKTIDIKFNEELNTEDKDTLDYLITNYTDSEVYSKNIKNISTVIQYSKFLDWFCILDWKENNNLKKIIITSMIDEGSYIIRVFDKNNNIVLGESLFENNKLEDCIIELDSYDIEDKAIDMEIHVKKITGAQEIIIKKACGEY